MKKGHILEGDCTHSASILSKLNNQRTQVHFCDCVVRQGRGQVYPVHRCILAASSPVLASMLLSSGVLVELEIPYLSDSILGLLLDYIYTGTLQQLDKKIYSYLLTAAQYLEMDELQNALRTKSGHAPGYYSSCDEDTKLTFLPSRKDGNKGASDSLHYGHTSESEILQKEDPHCIHLSLDVGSKYLMSDSVCKNKIDASSDYAIINTAKLPDLNAGITGTTLTSLKLIQSNRSCSKTQQMSTMCQNKENNLSACASKPLIWQESKEETRSCSSDSTKTQEKEQIQDEKTHSFCSQGNVKSGEINPTSQVQSHNFFCCNTSVIRHSSKVTSIHDENASKKPHDTETYTGKTSLSEKSYCDIFEDMETQNQHSDNQDLEQSAIPDHAYSVRHCNLIENNELMDNKYYFEKDLNQEEQHDQDPWKLSRIHDKSKVTTTFSQNEKNNTQLAKKISARSFQDERICAKRKLKEEQSEKCTKSAKTDLVYSAETVANNGSLYNNEQDLTWEDKNTSHTTLHRSLSVSPAGNTCQFPSYSGHLFYQWESQTDSRIFSDTPSEDNDVPVCSNLRNENATLSKGQVVLLDISSKSSEMLVSYERTAEMGTYAARNVGNMMTDSGQNGEGEKIVTASLTSCASACGKDCVHNSVSASVCDRIPSSGMQTTVSDRPSSPVPHAFQCSLCERSFSQRGSLNRHVRSHLGVRPFPCPHCPMTFSRQYRVVEHMRVHQRSVHVGTNFPKPPAS